MNALKSLPVATTKTIHDKMSNDIQFAIFINKCFNRFVNGDWGELSAEDTELNNIDPLTVLASYKNDDIKIWIKADIDHITILYPDEY